MTYWGADMTQLKSDIEKLVEQLEQFKTALRCPERFEGKGAGEPPHPPAVHPGGGGAGVEAGLWAGHPHRD